jgi:hypothetical protein
MVNHATLLVAVHPHVPVTVTAAVPVPPMAENASWVGVTEAHNATLLTSSEAGLTIPPVL